MKIELIPTDYIFTNNEGYTKVLVRRDGRHIAIVDMSFFYSHTKIYDLLRSSKTVIVKATFKLENVRR